MLWGKEEGTQGCTLITQSEPSLWRSERSWPPMYSSVFLCLANPAGAGLESALIRNLKKNTRKQITTAPIPNSWHPEMDIFQPY
jgi:hypothetical protein